MPGSDYQEYSYFRAEGQVAETLRHILDMRAQVQQARREILFLFGATSMVVTDDEDSGLFKIRMLRFPDKTRIPQGWVRPADAGSSFDPVAMPPAGSSDDFNLIVMAAQVARLYHRCRLEEALGCGDMPSKRRLAGYYSARFVREKTWLGPFRAYLGASREPDNHGYFNERNHRASGTTDTVMPDPLRFQLYDNIPYLRIPNTKTGAPFWTPPGCTRMDYDDMVRIDHAVYHRMHGAHAGAPAYGASPP